MSDEKDLSKDESLLIERCKKIWDEFEFVFGISLMCKGDEASNAMLSFMDRHPEATSSDIMEYATFICDKYNPDLNA